MFALFRTLLLIATVVFVAIFTVNNHDAVSLSLFPLPYAIDTSLSILAIGAFALGAITGGVLVSFRSLNSRIKLRKANKKIKRLEKFRSETSQLPMLPSSKA